MFSEHGTTSDSFGGSTPPRDPATAGATGEPEPPGEPRIRATLHDRTRWKQLLKDAATLTLDTLDHVGDRVGRELGLRDSAVKQDDAV